MPSPKKKPIGIARFDDMRGWREDIELLELPDHVEYKGELWERWTLLGPDDTPDGRMFALYRPNVPAVS